MRYHLHMRTTLDVDTEVLIIVKEIAFQQHSSAGAVVSELLRKALQPGQVPLETRNGIPLLPRRPNGPKITLEMVNRLRDEDE